MKKIKFSLSRTERGVKRSYAVDIVMYGLLLLFGIIMVIPFVFAISNALKPLSEFFYFPPRIRVENPTMDNFKDLFRLMSDSWVPFSRYSLHHGGGDGRAYHPVLYVRVCPGKA